MWRTLLLAPAVLAASLAWPASAAVTGERTVCTITINSSDEKEAFVRHLPEAKYRFVELVEAGRPDWLDAACRSRVRCDVLILSGHFDGRSVFYPDRAEEASEHLPMAELERISCSESCPALFGRLQEVYLFGCNTLNPQPQSRTTEAVVRSIMREKSCSRAEAERQLEAMGAGLAGSSRDRMREVFKDVPLIYGFESLAPVGEIAAATLERYFKAGGSREIARGQPSGRLLGHFAPFSMAATQGITDGDRLAAARQEICTFADQRIAAATKLAFAHDLLRQGLPRTLLHLDRIRRLMAALDDVPRHTPAVSRVLDAIAADKPARTRYLEAVRRVEQADIRVDLIDLGRDLGWLTDQERREALARLLGELHAQTALGLSDVDLACSLNRSNELDGAVAPPEQATGQGAAGRVGGNDAAHAALRACLGSAEGVERTLDALVSPELSDGLVAQLYLRHRPVADAAQLRGLAARVADMAPSDAQVNALEALGRHYVSDRGVVEQLLRLYASTASQAVQAAVAGILIRADREALGDPRLLRQLEEHRLPSEGGGGMLDALIRRLQAY